MATEQTNLALSATWTTTLRFDPKSALRTYPIKSGTAVTFTPGTAFAYEAANDASVVEPWIDADAGTKTIAMFLWDREVTRSASGEILATFMVDGRLHHDDVPTTDKDGTAITGLSQGALTTALKDVELRRLGFQVTGIPDAA